MKCFRHLPEGLFLRKKAPTTAYLDPAFPLGRRHFPLSNSIPFSVADLAPVNWATFGLTSMHLRYTRKKAQTVSTATAISRCRVYGTVGGRAVSGLAFYAGTSAGSNLRLDAKNRESLQLLHSVRAGCDRGPGSCLL